MSILKKIQRKILERPRKAIKFFSIMPEKYWTRNGLQLRESILKNTLQTVPAYKDFIHSQISKDSTVSDSSLKWEAVPYMDKKNYLTAYPLNALIPNRNTDNMFTWSQSSGYSGKPHYWPREKGQDYLTTLVTDIILTANFSIDRVSTLAVVGFSLGNWITGELVSSITRAIAGKVNYPLSVITPGSDLEEMYQNIIDIGPMYEQILLFGYPPMVKRLIDYGIANHIDWKKYNIKVVVTGEAYSEEWRDYIRKKLGAREKDIMAVMGFYGAADAGLLGIETPLSIAIRHHVNRSPELLRKLFDDDVTPSLVQFNPAVKYIEESAEKEILISNLGGMPLVKYNIHDKGGVKSFSDMVRCLRESNIDILGELEKRYKISAQNIWKWPFCYVYGRSDGTVSIDGANVYPTTIEQALMADDFAHLIESFRLHVSNDQSTTQKFSISLQLKPGIEKEIVSQERNKLEAHFSQLFLNHLLEANKDYAKSYQDHPHAVSPKVTLTPYATGVFENEESKIKHRYV